MKNLFFDFDGTIANTQEGVINALKYMANELSMKDLGEDTYKKFIGPALPDSLEKYYPDFSKNDYPKAIKTYQSYYNDKGIYQLELYPNMKKILSKLKDSGYNLYVSSVKPESLIKILIPHLELSDYFSGLYGASDDEITRNSKQAILKYGLDLSNAKPQDSLMIGDRMTDMQGGIANNVHTLGITYGFGDHDELSESGAEFIVDSVNEIPNGIKQFN